MFKFYQGDRKNLGFNLNYMINKRVEIEDDGKGFSMIRRNYFFRKLVCRNKIGDYKSFIFFLYSDGNLVNNEYVLGREMIKMERLQDLQKFRKRFGFCIQN